MGHDRSIAAEVFARRARLLTVVFAALLLLDFGLFGWLLFRSLSQRELERVLLETREDAEAVAESIGDQADDLEDLGGLSDQVDFVTELQSLARRRDIEAIMVRTAEGILLYSQGYDEDSSRLGAQERSIADLQVLLPESDLEVPIRGLGTLVVGLSREHLSQRVEELREHLLRLAGVVAALTTALLLGAYGVVTWLYRRSRALEEQAQSAERLAYLGTLASGLAHEIRNPLNAVNLNLQMLEEGAGDSRGRLFDITRSEVRRLERLVTDFLAYAKPRPLEREWVSVRELLAEAHELASSAFVEAGVDLEVEEGRSETLIWVDSSQIKQVIHNLLHNSLQVSAQFATGSETTEPSIVRLWVRPSGDGLALGVSDQGPGIPKDHREKVFEVFYSNRRGGTGLGLAIVRRFADAHGAKVQIDDGDRGHTRGERGATVSVHFPGDAVRFASTAD